MESVPATSTEFDKPIEAAELVDALDTLGVAFLRGGSGTRRDFPPAVLLTALASNPEARLRMALIPLLLAHPELAADVRQAERALPAKDAVVLRCYYTAAHWLQVKYRQRLEAACGLQPTLPDLFGEQLGIAEQAEPDKALGILALRQRQLTGITLNWLGTYEHAAQSWLRFHEQKIRWQQSRRSTSINF